MPPAIMPTDLHRIQPQKRLPATTGQMPYYSSEPTGESETKPAETKNDSLAIDRWHNLIRHEREFVFVYKTTQATLLRSRRSALFCPVCNLILNVIPAMLCCEANEGEAKAFPTNGKNHTCACDQGSEGWYVCESTNAVCSISEMSDRRLNSLGLFVSRSF